MTRRLISTATALAMGAALIVLPVTGTPANAAQSFSQFVKELWPDAKKAGVSRKVFNGALGGLKPDGSILKFTKKQPEIANPIGKYLKRRVSSGQVAAGRKKVKKWGKTLAKVERIYGVDRYVVAAIWGLETNFGGFTGGKNVIRSLATLAHRRYRGTFFRDQLIDALVILQQGHIKRAKMVGSWAGAMGQPQFMPSSFRQFAVDFDGNGRADIWKSVPDTLGSIANYLKNKGWLAGQPWGYEVVVPKSFKHQGNRGKFSQWQALGFRRADGGPLPKSGTAHLVFPSGIEGPAFLATQNYLAIRDYNSADSYVLSIGLLANRMRGRPGYAGTWPTRKPLYKHERVAVQRGLVKRGYKISNTEGRIDFTVRDAVWDYQVKNGLKPDGHPDRGLLKTMK